MDNYTKFKEDAKKNLKIADHMLFVTYPLIKDPKLLLAVMENIFLTLMNSMRYLLYYERSFKRVPSFFDTFESKYRLFSEKIIPKYEIDQDYLGFMRRMKNILLAHKRSPMEFSRQGKFVICSEDYQIEAFDQEDIKDYLSKAKLFFGLTKEIVERHELNETN